MIGSMVIGQWSMVLGETLISGEWIIALVVAIIGAVASGIINYQRGVASQQIRVSEPVPEVPIKKNYQPPTWDQHKGLEMRVTALEHTTAELRRDLAIQFRDLLQAGAEREARLSEKLDKMCATIDGRIDKMLENCRMIHSQTLTKRS